MNRLACGVFVLLAMSASSVAQTADDQIAQIARAVLAAPAAMAGDAMVVLFAVDGSHQVLREGSNGLVCYDRSDEPGRKFAVQCTSVENLAHVAQTHRILVAAGDAPSRPFIEYLEEVQTTLDAAETDGTREAPKYGSIWYSLDGRDHASVTPHQAHITIAVPFATSESLSLPSEGSYTQAGSWIMEAGTSAAHLMIPGR